MVRTCCRTLSAVVLIVLLAACQSTEPPKGRSGTGNAENKAEMARVVEQARTLSDVIDAEGSWEANITTYGQTSLTATVPGGTPSARAEELADELMALLWRSRLDPINGMGATVVLPEMSPSQSSLAGRLIQTRDGFGRLSEKLGPRPPR